jgi:hypothetical protein
MDDAERASSTIDGVGPDGLAWPLDLVVAERTTSTVHCVRPSTQLNHV